MQAMTADDVSLPRDIFVYGTLKKAYGNHRLLADSEFVGHAKLHIVGLQCVGFPIAEFTEDESAPLIEGEVYRVTDDKVLRNLDSLEGHPEWYVRTRMTTTDGNVVEVYNMKGDDGEGLIDEKFYDAEKKCYVWNR